VIVIVGLMQVKPEKVELFERLWRELAEASTLREEGCVFYRLTRSRTQPYTYRNIEVFRDQAAFDLHRQTDYLRDRMDALGECITGQPGIEYLDSIE
jgi:quinol monooxygenase YgiN